MDEKNLTKVVGLQGAFLLLLVLLGFVMCSCKCQQPAAATETSEERIVEIDTVYVTLPPQMAMEITNDSSSYLETDYATSFARINADGSLYHKLDTKQKPVAVPTKKITIRRIEKQTQVLTLKPKPTTWQRFKSIWFWVTASALAAWLAWRLRKKI